MAVTAFRLRMFPLDVLFQHSPPMGSHSHCFIPVISSDTPPISSGWSPPGHNRHYVPLHKCRNCHDWSCIGGHPSVSSSQKTNKDGRLATRTCRTTRPSRVYPASTTVHRGLTVNDSLRSDPHKSMLEWVASVRDAEVVGSSPTVPTHGIWIRTSRVEVLIWGWLCLLVPHLLSMLRIVPNKGDDFLLRITPRNWFHHPYGIPPSQ